eukprot:2864357-Lingulodinium_polyedra.AAC.1
MPASLSLFNLAFCRNQASAGSVVVFSPDHAPESGDCVCPSATTDRTHRTCRGSTPMAGGRRAPQELRAAPLLRH